MKKNLKASAISFPNIAFSKYWGKFNDELTLAMNDSISMTLNGLQTQTTIEFSPEYKEEQVFLGDLNQEPQLVAGSKKDRVVKFLDLLREKSGVNYKAKVFSTNSFPTGVGVASSASAFSALALAATEALGILDNLKDSPAEYKKQLSILTRLAGSGSACRSIEVGFVKWIQAENSEDSYAIQLADDQHWDLADLILIVASDEKKTSSLEGHSIAKSSPYYQARLEALKTTNANLEKAIKEKDFQLLGKEIEKEMFSLHMMAMTSEPSVLYWNGATVEIIKEVRALRESGLEVYMTLDAGPNPHLIVEAKNLAKLQAHFEKFPGVEKLFEAKIGKGAHLTNNHLF